MRRPSSNGMPKFPVGHGSIWTLSKSSMPRLRIAACHSGFSCTATIALIASSNSNAGRTSGRSSHETVSPEGNATIASTTAHSGLGTMSSRTRRSTVSPRSNAAMASFEGSSSVMVENRAASVRRPVAWTAATAASISSAVNGSRGWTRVMRAPSAPAALHSARAGSRRDE